MKRYNSIQIRSDNGMQVSAQAPVIISASRATDIPAFYAPWFFDRLEKGYIRWRNPFSGRDSFIALSNVRFIVFWSKNPAPIIPYLPRLKEKGIGCYFQFTLNDYVDEGLEPQVPNLDERIDTFRKLVDILGLGAVVWRFDPLILTDKIDVRLLIDKVCYIADQLKGYTEKLVFSFADISSYKKVGRNLSIYGINYHEWDELRMAEFSSRLSALNNDRYGLSLATCAELIDLSEYGIEHNRCIDPALIARLSPDNEVLQNYIFAAKVDSGQRKSCGCILSKDIGAYNTCPHGCLYCYANISPVSATVNYRNFSLKTLSDCII